VAGWAHTLDYALNDCFAFEIGSFVPNADLSKRAHFPLELG